MEQAFEGRAGAGFRHIMSETIITYSTGTSVDVWAWSSGGPSQLETSPGGPSGYKWYRLKAMSLEESPSE